MLRDDPAYADEGGARSRRSPATSRNIVARSGCARRCARPELRVAYHSACSMQHGQRMHGEPKALLAAAGFTVLEMPEAHICCGSAGTYNMLQPEISAAAARAQARQHREHDARRRRHRQYRLHHPDRAGSATPVLHTVELLDWATGGPDARGA